MFKILPCKDEKRLKNYNEGTSLLIFEENSVEAGSVAYKENGSAVEITELLLCDEYQDGDKYLYVDALVRSVGSIALNKGVITLCTRDMKFRDMLLRLGFFEHGEYLIIYLNKLFCGTCSGCKGDGCDIAK